MDLYVGQTSLKGDFRRYTKELNYVELLAEPQVLPNLKKLATLAAAAKGQVQFGVVLSPRAFGAEGAAMQAYFKKVVAACHPSWLVVRTPVALRPGTHSEHEIAAMAASLVSDPNNGLPDVRIAWEARGLWEPRAIQRVADQLAVIPVWDILSLPNTPLNANAYVRLAALGVGTKVNEGRLERLALRAQECETLHVVVEGKGAARTRKILASLLADPFAGLDEDSVLDDSDENEPGSVDDLQYADDEEDGEP